MAISTIRDSYHHLFSIKSLNPRNGIYLNGSLFGIPTWANSEIDPGVVNAEYRKLKPKSASEAGETTDKNSTAGNWVLTNLDKLTGTEADKYDWVFKYATLALFKNHFHSENPDNFSMSVGGGSSIGSEREIPDWRFIKAFFATRSLLDMTKASRVPSISTISSRFGICQLSFDDFFNGLSILIDRYNKRFFSENSNSRFAPYLYRPGDSRRLTLGITGNPLLFEIKGFVARAIDSQSPHLSFGPQFTYGDSTYQSAREHLIKSQVTRWEDIYNNAVSDSTTSDPPGLGLDKNDSNEKEEAIAIANEASTPTVANAFLEKVILTQLSQFDQIMISVAALKYYYTKCNSGNNDLKMVQAMAAMTAPDRVDMFRNCLNVNSINEFLQALNIFDSHVFVSADRIPGKTVDFGVSGSSRKHIFSSEHFTKNNHQLHLRFAKANEDVSILENDVSTRYGSSGNAILQKTGDRPTVPTVPSLSEADDGVETPHRRLYKIDDEYYYLDEKFRECLETLLKTITLTDYYSQHKRSTTNPAAAGVTIEIGQRGHTPSVMNVTGVTALHTFMTEAEGNGPNQPLTRQQVQTAVAGAAATITGVAVDTVTDAPKAIANTTRETIHVESKGRNWFRVWWFNWFGNLIFKSNVSSKPRIRCV